MARIEQLSGLRRVAFARIYAIQYSAERKGKSMVYVGCVISAISCVFSAISCVYGPCNGVMGIVVRGGWQQLV